MKLYSYADVPASEMANALEMCLVITDSTIKNQLKRIKFSLNLEYSLLDIATAEEHEIGNVEWPVPIKEKYGEDIEFWLFSDYVFDILKAIKKVAEENIFADMMGEQTIRIGKAASVVDGGNDLVYFMSEKINAIFAVAPFVVQ